MMLKTLIVLSATFLFAASVDAEEYIDAPIGIDTVWSADGGPYVTDTPIKILAGSRLEVLPGTVVIGDGAIRFEIEGTLSVQGEFGGDGVQFVNLNGADVETHFIVRDGDLDVNGTSFPNKIVVSAEGGSVSWASSSARISVTASNRADVTIDRSSLGDGSIRVLGESVARIKDSALDGLSGIEALASSSVTIVNSTGADAPYFLALDGSLLSIVGTNMVSVGGNKRHLFQATRGSTVLLDRSNVDAGGFGLALATASSSIIVKRSHASAAPIGVEAYDRSSIALNGASIQGPIKIGGSSASIVDSRLFDAPEDALYLSDFGAIKPALSMASSTIEGFQRSGVYAVSGRVEAAGVIFRGGSIGVESIFASTTIVSSTFSGQSEAGVAARVPSAAVLAARNFWGDASGPHHDLRNASGTGVAAIGSVDFSPWLESDPVARCCSSVLFIPGFQASRFFMRNGDALGGDVRVWEPDPLLASLTLRLALDEGWESDRDLYVGSAIDEAVVPVLGKNYYKSLFADLNDLVEGDRVSDWSVVPYDWRLSAGDVVTRGEKVAGGLSYIGTTTSPYIRSELLRLAAGSRTGKVTIVAHSNGGLIAKALLIDPFLADAVDALVMVATPQVGTPHAIGALLHGFDQGVIPVLLGAQDMARIGRTMPGAYGLLPSDLYHSIVSTPVVEFFGALSGRVPISSVDALGSVTMGILDGRLSGAARELHRSLDAWEPPAGLRVVEVAGWGIDTVSGLRYSSLDGKRSYRPILTEDGDGTVVAPSALALPSSDRVTRYWVNLSGSNGESLLNRKHAQIFESEPVRRLVRREILRSGDAVEWVTSTPPDPSSLDKKLRYFLYGERMSINLYDGLGNHTGPIGLEGDVEEAVPGSSYAEFGDVKVVSVPVASVRESNRVSPPTPGSSSVRLVITVRSDSVEQEPVFSVEVEGTQNGATSSGVAFYDVSVTASSTAELDVVEDVASSSPPLVVDVDGDGDIDAVIEPSVQAGEVEIGATTQIPSRHGTRRRLPAYDREPSPIEAMPTQIPVPDHEVFVEYAENDVPKLTSAEALASANGQNDVQSLVAAAGVIELPGQLLRNEHTPMKKVLWFIVLLALIGAGAYAYVTRPVSAPTIDVEGAAGKLPAGSATSSVYQIQSDGSLVKFTMNELLNGKPFLVVGTTTEVAGQISVDASGVRFGSLAVNAKTFVTDNPRRDNAINRAILKTEGNPANELITFVPKAGYSGAVTPGQPVTFNLEGDLTISGVTKPATFKVTMTVSGDQVTGTATTTIKRSDFGLVIPNIPFVANVDDEFPVTVQVVADRIML